MTEKPTLFIGLEGPILIPSKDPDAFLGTAITPYAQAFLHWATQHFDTRLLTDRGFRDAHYVLNQLKIPAHTVPIHGFVDSKVGIFDEASKNFYWVDSDVIPGEVTWLAQHGHMNRLIPVDPVTGVTPEHKTRLEQQLNKHNG